MNKITGNTLILKTIQWKRYIAAVMTLSGHIWTLPVSQGNTHLTKVFVTLVFLLTIASRHVFID